MGVNLKQKREFIMWLHDNVNFGRRDVYWLLNYLLNHKAILQQVVFVERAEKTPRGLKINALVEGDQSEPLELYIEQRIFTDPEQVFHELRMNWKQELYVEVNFPEAWETASYLAVLEDNPFYLWNENVDATNQARLDQALENEAQARERDELLAQIDLALEAGNQAEFERLSEALKESNLTKLMP